MQKVKDPDLQYLRDCKKFSAAAAFTPLALSFLRANQFLLPPPLGPVSQVGLGVMLLVTGLFSYAPLQLSTKRSAKRLLWLSALGSLICLVAYLFAVSRYVVDLERVGHPTGHAVVGSERTQFALENYPNTSDSDLVLAYGRRSVDLDNLYTRTSLIGARLLVVLPYILMLIMIQLFIGSWARTRKS
jgi:hypothetical protein